GGFKLPDSVEDRIAAALATTPRRPTGAHVGRRLPDPDDGAGWYVDHLVATLAHPLDGLRIVVDCANGAAYVAAPEVLRRLGAEVTPLFVTPDGSNINDGCGALHPEVVAKAVLEHGADAGLALDGDADRALFADADGSVIDGDQVLAACAIALDEDGRLPGGVVVSTVMANLGLHEAMRSHGLELLETKVGDRYVLEEMLARGAALGGEQSGHVIFREHATTGDGLLTAVRFLSLAARRRCSVAELASAMRKFPQALVNVPVEHKERLDADEAIGGAIAEARRRLDGSGRVLVRASGTEPLVRVMVEAESEDLARRLADELAAVVRDGLR
ncbi:MAG: phosphoglucosamine mutase, partial [Actinomycetota bacterium]